MNHTKTRLDAYLARPEVALANDHLDALIMYVESEAENLKEENDVDVDFVLRRIQQARSALNRPLEEHKLLSDKKLMLATEFQNMVTERDESGVYVHSQVDIDQAQLDIEQMLSEHAGSMGMEAYFFASSSNEYTLDRSTPSGVASLNRALQDIHRIHEHLQDHNFDLTLPPVSPLETVLTHVRQRSLAHLSENAPELLNTLAVLDSEKRALFSQGKAPATELINAAELDLGDVSLGLIRKESHEARRAYFQLVDALKRPETPHFDGGRINIRHTLLSPTEMESEIYHVNIGVDDEKDRYTKLGAYSNTRILNDVGEQQNKVSDGELVRIAHRIVYEGNPDQGVAPICREAPAEAAARVIHNAHVALDAIGSNSHFSKQFANHLTACAEKMLAVANEHGGEGIERSLPTDSAPANPAM